MPIPPDWSMQLTAFVNKWKSTNGLPDEYLGDTPFDKFVFTERAESWSDFLGWLDELQGSWCFRGQREVAWLLHTSLDRAVKKEWASGDSTGYYRLDREMEQRDLFFRFRQQAHLYIRHIPSNDDLGSWFALMQHHGIPTRLLDWTRSPYVGMYFALELEPQGSSAVWAIDMDWLETKGHELLGTGAAVSVADGPNARAEHVNDLLRHEEKPVIVKISPLIADERMAAQQGLLLCKLIHQATFNQLLMNMIIHAGTTDRPVVRKLEVEGKHRIDSLKNLRAMNIHRASLFPGLDGFSQSLRLDLEIKVKGSEA